MKVYFELPDKWLDSDLTGNLEWITKTVKEAVERKITDALVKEAISKTELPKIEVDKKKLEKVILNKIAEKAMEKYE